MKALLISKAMKVFVSILRIQALSSSDFDQTRCRVLCHRYLLEMFSILHIKESIPSRYLPAQN